MFDKYLHNQALFQTHYGVSEYEDYFVHRDRFDYIYIGTNQVAIVPPLKFMWLLELGLILDFYFTDDHHVFFIMKRYDQDHPLTARIGDYLTKETYSEFYDPTIPDLNRFLNWLKPHFDNFNKMFPIANQFLLFFLDVKPENFLAVEGKLRFTDPIYISLGD